MKQYLIQLPEAEDLMLEKIRELEDNTYSDLFSKAISLYTFFHEQIAKGNKVYITDNKNNVKLQVIFVNPQKRGWFNEGEGNVDRKK